MPGEQNVQEQRISMSKYRLSRAEEMLRDAKLLLDANSFPSANNRACYCIFHAMRAVLALSGEDYKKHSAVISRFSQQYLKSDILPRKFGRVINRAEEIRNQSDYDDFFVCSNEEVSALVADAERFLEEVKDYLTAQYNIPG